MVEWSKLRRRLSRTVTGLALMFAGAWLLTQYLEWGDPVFRHSWSDLDQGLAIGFWLCLLINVPLQPAEDRAGRSTREPSPRFSGAILVMMTGCAAATSILLQQTDDRHYLLPGFILLGTVAATAGVWRFATAYAAEIGEARFKS